MATTKVPFYYDDRQVGYAELDNDTACGDMYSYWPENKWIGRVSYDRSSSHWTVQNSWTGRAGEFWAGEYRESYAIHRYGIQPSTREEFWLWIATFNLD